MANKLHIGRLESEMVRDPACPSCKSLNVRLLHHVTSRHSPDFYRCVSCGNVWFIPKHDNGSATDKPKGSVDPDASTES